MNIYVGNLPYSAEESDVKELFEEYGEVFSVKLVEDRETGRKKGFGFVEMEQTGGMKAIEELNESEYDSRTIVVNEARPREQKQRNFRRSY